MPCAVLRPPPPLSAPSKGPKADRVGDNDGPTDRLHHRHHHHSFLSLLCDAFSRRPRLAASHASSSAREALTWAMAPKKRKDKKNCKKTTRVHAVVKMITADRGGTVPPTTEQRALVGQSVMTSPSRSRAHDMRLGEGIASVRRARSCLCVCVCVRVRLRVCVDEDGADVKAAVFSKCVRLSLDKQPATYLFDSCRYSVAGDARPALLAHLSLSVCSSRRLISRTHDSKVLFQHHRLPPRPRTLSLSLSLSRRCGVEVRHGSGIR